MVIDDTSDLYLTRVVHVLDIGCYVPSLDIRTMFFFFLDDVGTT